MAGQQEFVRRVCAGCGAAALVAIESVHYRCDRCQAAEVPDEGAEDMRVSRFWSDNRGNAGVGGAFAALDEVFNPAAARAQERVKGDHERQVPKPSPGDDALRTGSLVIRVEKPRTSQDN